MKQQVVVYKALPDVLMARLRDEFDVIFFDGVNADNRAAFHEAVKHADGMIGANVPIPNVLLEQAPKLKIASSISVGVDQFDLDYFRQRGLMLAHTPGVLDEGVADLVFALILSSARRVVEMAEFVRAGKWNAPSGKEQYGVSVQGKTLGILGMGRIGNAVARRAHHGFGMPIIYHNRRPDPEAEQALSARYVSKDTLLAQADFLCVMLPLTKETERAMGRREFALMKPSAIFINASRGKVVDEAALIQALQQKIIYAAGLDVFEQEPVSVDSPLLTMPNVVALPHIGSATFETRFAMAELAVDNLIAGLRGERPAHLAV
ncbi:MAG TPA: D-glycerate dehydrogenase [Herbaspirillum sp.]|jgi:gluconate 2-dehydrogenase